MVAVHETVTVDPDDLRDYQRIVSLFEAGQPLSHYSARIKELDRAYGVSQRELLKLKEIVRSVRYEVVLANKMQTFASDKDRAEGDLFVEMARAVSEHVKREAKRRDSFPIDAYTAEFLGLDEGMHGHEEIGRALAKQLGEHFADYMRNTISSGYSAGHRWEHVLGAVETLTSKLAPLVPAGAERTVLLDAEQERIRQLARTESRLEAQIQTALLNATSGEYAGLTTALDEIRSGGFESGAHALMANALAKLMQAADLPVEDARVRQHAEDWAQELTFLTGRSQSAEWTASLAKERHSLAQEGTSLERLVKSIDRLRETLASASNLQRPTALAQLVAFEAVDDEAHRKAWAGVSAPLVGLRERAQQLRAAVRRRLEAIPTPPPAEMATQQDWARWVDEARTKLAKYMEASGASGATDRARDCLDATRRELSAWQVRQRTKPEVVRQIDSGAPWEKVAAAAAKVGESEVARAVEVVFGAVKTAKASWKTLVPASQEPQPAALSVAMYALSKSSSDVEILARIILDAWESGAAPDDWWGTWLDAFGDRAGQWGSLLRYLTSARRTLSHANGPTELLWEVVADELRPGVLLDAHRVVRGLKPPRIELDAFDAVAERVRQLLDGIQHATERALVRLESRLALYSALALVPLGEDAGAGLRPLWQLHDPSAWATHLEPAWIAVLQASDDLYWKTRALAPLSRRTGTKRELALLGLTETMHLSAGVLEEHRAATRAADDAVPNAAEMLHAALAVMVAAGEVSRAAEVRAWVRSKLERQLRHVGLGLLTLELESPSDYAANQANWLAEKVGAGLGAPATSLALLERLRRMFDDAEWVLQRTVVLERKGVKAGLELRDLLDVSRAAGPGVDVELVRVLDQMLSLDDGGDSGDPYEARAARVVSDALTVVGTSAPRTGDRQSKALWSFALLSVQQYSLRFMKTLLPDARADILRRLRAHTIESPDDASLRSRLGQLVFLDPDDNPTLSLRNHLIRPSR